LTCKNENYYSKCNEVNNPGHFKFGMSKIIKKKSREVTFSGLYKKAFAGNVYFFY